jgi:hypothetical protein
LPTPLYQYKECNTLNYEDNLFLASNPCPVKDALIKQLSSTLVFTNLGLHTNQLGIGVVKNSTANTLTHNTLAESLLEEIGSLYGNPKTTPINIGSTLEVHPPLSPTIPKEEFPFLTFFSIMIQLAWI